MKVSTSSPEEQLQPSLQQYESDVVVLQLKTGLPKFVALGRTCQKKYIAYQHGLLFLSLSFRGSDVERGEKER